MTYLLDPTSDEIDYDQQEADEANAADSKNLSSKEDNENEE